MHEWCEKQAYPVSLVNTYVSGSRYPKTGQCLTAAWVLQSMLISLLEMLLFLITCSTDPL